MLILALLGQASRARGEEYSNQARTTGWLPSCTCAAGEPTPCLILDPFSGTGTTVSVAMELGRRGIGVDIAAEYNHDHGAARLERTQPALIAAGV